MIPTEQPNHEPNTPKCAFWHHHLTVYLLIAIAVGSAMIGTGGDWGVGFCIGVGFTIWVTRYPKHGITTCP